jgi:hypothetical protein
MCATSFVFKKFNFSHEAYFCDLNLLQNEQRFYILKGCDDGV